MSDPPAPFSDSDAWLAWAPLRPSDFADPAGSAAHLDGITHSGASPDLLAGLWVAFREHLGLMDSPDEGVGLLGRFIQVSRSPTSLLALFERDAQALPSLLQVLSTSNAVAELLIGDPEIFDLIRASDGRPATRELLSDELTGELRSAASIPRAAVAIRRYAGREILRIAYGEFVRGLPPDRAARQISHLIDAMIDTALDFTIAQTASRLSFPQRIDGTQPRYAIIALGNYGGEEIGYDSPLDLLLLCDQIDRKNESHVKFNQQIVAGLMSLLGSNRNPVVSINLRFVAQPGEEVLGGSDTQRLNEFLRSAERSTRPIDFHAADATAAYFERENQTTQRLAFVKARVAAGDETLGKFFLQQIQPWVYHRLLSRSEIADIRVLRRKLEKRVMADTAGEGTPIAETPGGRRDIELTIQFLQLLHGSDLPEVRVTGTLDAIEALNRHGCLTQQEASILSENHARLCRLEHHLAVLFDHRVTHLPDDDAVRTRLAWRLGVRSHAIPSSTGTDATGIENTPKGDRARFEKMLSETLEVNRKIINHLMVQDVASRPLGSNAGIGIGTASDDAKDTDNRIDNRAQSNAPNDATDDASDHRETNLETPSDPDAVEIETELILDPDPDLETYREVLKGHGLIQIERAIDYLSALSHETVLFLSPRRCRHFFAGVAPDLLREIATTPAPDQTLARLVEVTDSIGAKATLWELLSTNPATLHLMVRLCSLSPYLTAILIDHPGMIDELVDSLVMDRLPRAERLDMQTIRLCQSADDLQPILQTFKAGCHLMIGVRDLLDKESVDAIGESLSDTAEACLRRVIEFEQERLAARFGDPVDEQGNAVEMVAVALGKFGGREPNYHSDLDLTFLYTEEGETQRRVGGPRRTLSHRQFFHQLAQNVIRHIDSETARLYEVDTPLSGGADESVLAQSIEQFSKPFRHGGAPLWQRGALCQARPCSGSRAAIERVRDAIGVAITGTPWRDSQLAELKTLRLRGESTATPGNLKRGPGGTADVQTIVAAGVLRSTNADTTNDRPSPFPTGIVPALAALAETGVYQPSDTETLTQNYRYLRNVEAKLRLINTTTRHELPLTADGTADTLEMKQLAALLGQSDPANILNQCDEARRSTRELFDRLLDVTG